MRRPAPGSRVASGPPGSSGGRWLSLVSGEHWKTADFGKKRRGTAAMMSGTADASYAAMVRFTIALTPTSARCVQELLDALRFIVLGTRLEPGCLRCRAWADADSTVRYLEEWAAEADMKRHVRSETFTSLLSILESAANPHVQFDFVTKSRGLDYVEEIRHDMVN